MASMPADEARSELEALTRAGVPVWSTGQRIGVLRLAHETRSRHAGSEGPEGRSGDSEIPAGSPVRDPAA